MPNTSGILSTAKTMFSTLLSMVQTRVSLLANELEEDRLRMIRLLFLGLLVMFFFCLSVVLFTLLVIAVFWDTNRLLAIGLVASFYLVIAAVLLAYVLREAKHKPKLFSVSLAELAKDCAVLEHE